jgi:hypothetical protein
MDGIARSAGTRGGRRTARRRRKRKRKRKWRTTPACAELARAGIRDARRADGGLREARRGCSGRASARCRPATKFSPMARRVCSQKRGEQNSSSPTGARGGAVEDASASSGRKGAFDDSLAGRRGENGKSACRNWCGDSTRSTGSTGSTNAAGIPGRTFGRRQKKAFPNQNQFSQTA